MRERVARAAICAIWSARRRRRIRRPNGRSFSFARRSMPMNRAIRNVASMHVWHRTISMPRPCCKRYMMICRSDMPTSTSALGSESLMRERRSISSTKRFFRTDSRRNSNKASYCNGTNCGSPRYYSTEYGPRKTLGSSNRASPYPNSPRRSCAPSSRHRNRRMRQRTSIASSYRLGQLPSYCTKLSILGLISNFLLQLSSTGLKTSVFRRACRTHVEA